MNIGIIGFGGVAKAFVNLLIDKRDKFTDDIKLKYIINSKGGLYNKKGIDLYSLIDSINDKEDIINHIDWKYKLNIDDVILNNDIEYIIELTSTNIDNGEPGLTHIKKSLTNKINVITGNKGPILIEYNQLKEIAKKNNVELMIGCTTGGALPSISCGLIGCAGSDINSIQGILNGTSNYILSMMSDNDMDYEKALKQAQDLGIAEIDPKLDVSGIDTAIKLIILSNVLMGSNLKLSNIKIEGITNVNKEYIKTIKFNNNKLKLIGEATKIDESLVASVSLKVIDESHPLYNIDYNNKGILYKTDTLGDILIAGGKSGTVNAAAAILRDLINLKHTENK